MEVEDARLQGPLLYLAEVTAGGRVEGSLTLADGLAGTLEIQGTFQEGFMRYHGDLTREHPG